MRRIHARSGPASTARARAVVLLACAGLIVAACGDSSGGGTTTTQGSVAAAQANVDAAKADLTKAQSDLTDAKATFCTGSKDYITAIDRYGKAFSDSAATVGDVQTAGADLEEPRAAAQSAATDVSDAVGAVTAAEQQLANAEAALAAAQAAASGNPAPTTSSTTSTTLVPPATISRVQQAESDLATTAEGITAQTPLTEATAEFNSAAFALEIAWLQLINDAGCLTDDQQAQAVAQVHDYTVALQTELTLTGYYTGPVDGIYGPETVAAVKQLQTDSSLPTTGFVDQATAAALDAKVQALGAADAQQALIQTTALQSVLKLAGYWTGPIDGIWTPALTDALKAFQTALGVPPTGEVDAATLAALETAIANLKAAPSTTTTPTSSQDTTTTTA
jgi:peptidoglycan hydrolase-like protein with peptidoglycan-binding domain